MYNIIENMKVKDKNGNEFILTNETQLYDTVNEIMIKANYKDCLDEIRGWNMIVDNILSGRLTLNVC